MPKSHYVVSVCLALGIFIAACRGVESAPPEVRQPQIVPPRDGEVSRGPSGDLQASGAEPATGPSGGGRLLQLSDLFGTEPLEGRHATGLTFSHDGRWLYYLRPSAADGQVLDLWRLALPKGAPEIVATAESLLAQGKAELTDAQKSAQERQRVRHQGITSFVLDRVGASVILPLGGFVFRLDLGTRKATRIFSVAGGEMDPRPSPDGTRLAFVRGGNVILRDLATGAERSLTRGGGDTLQYGVAEFVAQEELDRHRGFWWSPSGETIALTEVDESGVEKVLRYQISASGVKVVPQRYPAAGTPNAKVRLGLVQVATGQVRWIAFGTVEAGYLARVSWFGSTEPGRSPRLAVQWLSRDQRELSLFLVDPVTLAVRRVLVEHAPDYVNLHQDLKRLDGRPGLVWTTEASGMRQVEIHSIPGPGEAPVVVRPEGTGAAAVDTEARKPMRPARLSEPLHRVVRLDEKGGWLYATVLSNRGRELHLYRLALDGAHLPQKLTQKPGWHEITMNREATHYVDTWSDLDTPPQITLHAADGALLRTVDENPPDHWHGFQRAQARFVTIRAPNEMPLNGLLLTPAQRPGGAPAPAVIYVYGGPHGQIVAQRWHRSLPWHHYFVQHGFAVLLVDGRGTAHRGKGFETQLWRRFGEVDVEDVTAAASWLGEQPGIHKDRMGLWGWSYGGYLAVMTALRTGRLFRAAVAVAPVGDWRLYDTAYTERYLGMPDSEKAVYSRSDPVPLAPKLQTPLLLVHGMADDNVLLTHTLRLAQALQDAERPFDMMLYPGKAHSLQGTSTRRHLLSTVLRYFQQHLQAEGREAPPR